MAVKLSKLEKVKRSASRAFHDKERARLEYENDPFGRPLRTELPDILRESKTGRPSVSFKVTYEREQLKYDEALKAYRKAESLEGLKAADLDHVHNHLKSQKSSAGRVKLDEIGLIEKYHRRKLRHLKELTEKKELPYKLIDESQKLRNGRPKRSFDEVREVLEKCIRNAQHEIKIRVEKLSTLDKLEYDFTQKKLEISNLKRFIKTCDKGQQANVAQSIKQASDESQELKSEIKSLKKKSEKEIKKTVAEAKRLYQESQPKKSTKSKEQIKIESAQLLMDVALCLSGQKVDGINATLNLLSKTDLKIKFKEIEVFLGV